MSDLHKNVRLLMQISYQVRKKKLLLSSVISCAVHRTTRRRLNSVCWLVFPCVAVLFAAACSAASVWGGVGVVVGGLDGSCVEPSVGDSLSVATAPGSV